MVLYSHSKLSTFEQCPLKYKFRYIDKLTPEIEQTIEGFLGNKVHETLEWIYQQAIQGNIVELDKVIDYYLQTWYRDFNSEIKIVKQECDEQSYIDQGIKFLIDYYFSNQPFKDNTLETEKKIILNLDSEGKYQLIGYIDRLVHNKETNIFEIHDYKTGSLKSQEELDRDRQLALYSMAIREQFGEVNDVHLIWHFLAFNKKMTSKRNLDELQKLKAEIIELIKKIEQTQDFQANPGCLCSWCEFKGYCSELNKK